MSWTWSQKLVYREELSVTYPNHQWNANEQPCQRQVRGCMPHLPELSGSDKVLESVVDFEEEKSVLEDPLRYLCGGITAGIGCLYQ